MSEVQIPVEVLHRPPGEMPALQGRMLLKNREFLNPNNTTEAPALSKENIATFGNRDYGLFESAAIRERKAHWQRKEGGFDTHYNEWSGSMVKMLNAEKNKQMMDPLKPLFAKIGVENNVWGAQDVKKMYDRYLDNTSPDSGIKQFVSDVLATRQRNGVFQFNIDDITQNRDALVWLSQIFGEKSSQVIDQLLMAETALASLAANRDNFEPDLYFGNINQNINNVSEPEKELMKFLWNGEVSSAATPGIEGKRDGQTIEDLREPIQEALLDPLIDNVVVSAGTGAGKTTEIPQFIRQILKSGEKIAVTQPRRVAVDKLSERIAMLLDVELGKEVGKQHGGETLKSKDTDLLLTVEGSLLRKFKRDPMLLEFKYIMIDEWHERHKDTDKLVALILRAQKLRKEAGEPPLKMIITSATMDSEDLKKQLGTEGVTVFNIEGNKKYTITPSFEAKNSDAMNIDLMPARAALQAEKMIKSRPGRNIVIFMPGERTILQTQDLIQKMNLPNVVITPFYREMNEEDKKRALEVDDGKQHIIIASPIAETSLTIPKADVISSGYVNIPEVDPDTGFMYLREKLHSKDGLMQQRGRTGRESDGMFHFLGTQAEYDKLVQRHPAEIVRTDLSDTILLFKSLGVEMNDLRLIDRELIPQKNIDRATRRLKDLGALNNDGTITEIGEAMAGYPLEVHLARMMYEAEQKGAQESMATVIAMAGQTALFERVAEEQKGELAEAKKKLRKSYTSDYVNLLHIYRQFQDYAKDIGDKDLRETARRRWCDDNYIRFDTMIKVGEAKSEILERVGIDHIERDNVPLEIVERCVFEGLRDNIMKRTNTKEVVSKDRKGKETGRRTVYQYTISHEPSVNNAVIDKDSVVTPSLVEYAVSAGNYVRQRDNGKSDQDVYMQLNQAVPASWVV